MKTLHKALAGVFAAAAMVGGNSIGQVVYDSTPRYVSPASTGVIDSIDVVRTEGGSRGDRVGGTILGGIVGGVIGHQFGSGRGNDAATVAGALGGAAVGHNLAENRGSTTAAYRVNVRLDDGGLRTFYQSDVYGLNVGDRVQIDRDRVLRYADTTPRYQADPRYQPDPRYPPQADPRYTADSGYYQAETTRNEADSRFQADPRYQSDPRYKPDFSYPPSSRSQPDPGYQPAPYRYSSDTAPYPPPTVYRTDEPVARYMPNGVPDRRVYRYDAQGYRVDQWGNRYDAEGYWVDERGNRHEYQDPPMGDNPPNRLNRSQ
jgi:uncharacterized protein YcfJ